LLVASAAGWQAARTTPAIIKTLIRNKAFLRIFSLSFLDFYIELCVGLLFL
jgi:hypothetical protein